MSVNEKSGLEAKPVQGTIFSKGANVRHLKPHTSDESLVEDRLTSAALVQNSTKAGGGKSKSRWADLAHSSDAEDTWEDNSAIQELEFRIEALTAKVPPQIKLAGYIEDWNPDQDDWIMEQLNRWRQPYQAWRKVQKDWTRHKESEAPQFC